MQFVDLGLGSFAVCWLCTMAAHAATGAFYAVVAAFYWRLGATHFAVFLKYYSIGMPASAYRIIAVVHVVCAVPHVAAIMAMLCSSLSKRTLAFSSRYSLSSILHLAVKSTNRRIMTTSAHSAKTKNHLALKSTSRLMQQWHLRNAFDFVFGRTGVVGVGGKHYSSILLIRELTETAIQTAQAYQMSMLLPREKLNRLYSGLIVLNCWITVILHVAFATRAAHQRLVSLLFDCALDLVASAGITLVVVSYYLPDYDWIIEGFLDELWSDDLWFSQAKNELQLVLVTSWTDLCARVVFAVGAMLSLSDIKALLRLRRNRSFVRRSPVAREGPAKTTVHGLLPVELNAKSSTLFASRHSNKNGAAASAPSDPDPVQLPEITPVPVQKKWLQHAGVKLGHSTFILWGLIVLVLHLQASSLPKVDQCRLQVRPWGVSVPSCYLVDLDCAQSGIAGSSQQVTTMWEEFRRETVERITIRRCPALEMPPMVQGFSRINTLKVYNSTIVSWNSGAAITATLHPQIALIYLVRVTLPNGEIPAGLLSPDSPTTLQEITFCVTNLRVLPDDLDEYWPKRIAINLELSELTSVPDCLLRLQPRSLSLYGNPLDTVPSALFEIEGMTDLDVGESNLVALPEHVESLSSTLLYVYLPNTMISVFWNWIDPLIERANPFLWAVYLPGTPYCAAYESILNESTTAFDVPEANSSISLLMDAEGHWDEIYTFVNCDPYFAQPFFPLATEDTAATEQETG